MKTRIFIFSILCFFAVSSAKASGKEVYNLTYTFKNVPANFDISQFQLAIANSDFECFRFETQRRTFEFENGITLEIFSAQEVQTNTFHISSCFLPDDTKVSPSVLTLGENNTIIMNMESKQKTRISN